MLSTGAAPPAVQLAITLLLCLVSTLAFFGLVRGLERICDDELIEQWAANNDEPVQPTDLNAFLAGGSSSGSTDGSGSGPATEPNAGADGRSTASRSSGPESGTVDASSDESTVRCRHCGEPNPEGVSYCAECVGRL